MFQHRSTVWYVITQNRHTRAVAVTPPLIVHSTLYSKIFKDSKYSYLRLNNNSLLFRERTRPRVVLAGSEIMCSRHWPRAGHRRAQARESRSTKIAFQLSEQLFASRFCGHYAYLFKLVII